MSHKKYLLKQEKQKVVYLLNNAEANTTLETNKEVDH